MVVMRLASHRDVWCNAALCQSGDGGRAEVAGIQGPRWRCAQRLGQGVQGRYHLRLIIGMVGEGVRHNQQAVVLGRNLGIVMLVKAVIGAVFHDARLRIGEVVLILVARPRLWRFRRRAAGFPPLLARFFFSRVPFRFVRSAFGLIAFLRAGCQHRFRLRQIGQALLATGDCIGEDQPVGQGHLVRLLAEREQLVDFGVQLMFEFQQTLGTDGMAFGGVGVDLGAVQADVAQLQHARGLGQEQDLHKQVFEFGQKRLAEVGDGVMIGMQVASQEAQGERLVRRLLDPPRTAHARGVAVEQQPQQNLWGERLTAACAIAHVQTAQVQLRDDICHKARQVVRRQRFAQTHRQIECGFVINGFEFSCHAHSLARS